MSIPRSTLLVGFLVSLLSGSSSSTAAASCNSQDEEALLAFKNGDQNRTRVLTGWTKQSGCCTWSGVKCDGASGRVSELRLESLGLTGTLSSGLGSLSHLRKLSVHENGMDGPIPSSFGDLRLQVLDLGDNSFSGELPPSLARLASTLQTLDLSRYSFDGTIPSELSKLTSLEALAIAATDATGRIPGWLANLKKLKVLHLSGNAAMRGPIPTSLAQLASLEELGLSGTGLTGEIPSSLGRLRRLVKLDLSSNSLSGQIPGSLGQLSRLVVLDLSSNYLSGSIPESLGLLSSLDAFSASQNELSGRVPEGFGRGLGNLTELQLSGNNITGLPTSMTKLTSLKEINLADNHLRSFDAISGLATLPAISVIDLSNCKLHGPIPSWFGSINLEENPAGRSEIDLSFNSITGNIPAALGRIFNLTHLSLQSNKLQGRLPDSFGETLPRMRYLELSYNSLTGVPAELSNLGKNELFYLGLSHNNLSFQALEGLTTLSQVSHLELDHSHLTGAIPSWFSKIPMVQDDFTAAVLSLSSNRITGKIPPELGQLTQVVELYLDGNALTGAMPPSLANLTSLQRLDLAENRLSGGIPVEFLALKALVYFNVSYNQLTGAIPEGAPLIDIFPGEYEGNPGLCGKPLPPCL